MKRPVLAAPQPPHRASRPAVLEQAGPALDGLLAPLGLAPAGRVDALQPALPERPLRAERGVVAERGAQDAEPRDELVEREQAGVPVEREDLRPQLRVR